MVLDLLGISSAVHGSVGQGEEGVFYPAALVVLGSLHWKTYLVYLDDIV